MRKHFTSLLLAERPRSCHRRPPSLRRKRRLYMTIWAVRKAITAVVDEFVGRVAADNRINAFFKQTASDPKRLASFKAKLVDQICQASGGPCKYKGKDMKAAHWVWISGADFNALVEDLGGRAG